MKIHIAAHYSRAEEMQNLAEQLRAVGHEIVSRWLLRPQPAADEAERCAEEDIHDLIKADTLAMFNAQPHTARSGIHVLFGVALARNMRLIVVGNRENYFQYLRKVEHVDDARGLVAALTAADLTQQGQKALFDHDRAQCAANAIKGR